MMIYCDDLHLTDVKFLVYYLYIELKSVVIDNFFTIRYLNWESLKNKYEITIIIIIMIITIIYWKNQNFLTINKIHANKKISY